MAKRIASHLGLLLLVILLCMVPNGRCKKRNRKMPKSFFPLYSYVNSKSARGQLWIKKMLDPKVYNQNIRPQIGKDGQLSPTIVKTTLAINSLGAVREYTMEFKAQFRFQQEWFDHRLIFNDSSFGDKDYLFLAHDQKIWYPDTFFQNEKTARYHDFDQPNVFIAIRKDGYVIYNRRLTMTFACTMKLKKYPLDSQLCFIEFASYAYTTADIIYVWSEKPLDIGIESVKALSNFRILYYGNDSCTSNTSTGAYSCLRVVLYMKRVFSFFFLQLYIPSTLLVAVSWVSYWIDWRAAAGRVPLAIVTLLAMITQSHAINANLPPVSYAKAIDVWVGACVMFIFGSLLEYALVNFTGISDQKKKAEIDEKRLSQLGVANFFDQGPLTGAPSVNTGVPMVMNVAEPQDNVIPKSSVFGESTILVQRKGSPTRRRRPNPRFSNYSTDSDFIIPAAPPAPKAPPGLFDNDPFIHNFFGPIFSAPETTQFDESPPYIRQRHQATDQRNGGGVDLAVHFEDVSDHLNQNRRRLRRQRRRRFLDSGGFFLRTMRTKSRADRIDFVSRFLFPVLFVSFNVVYWIIYWSEWNDEKFAR